MAWCQSVVDELRLLILPDSGDSGEDIGRLISLRHPKSGTKTCYLLTNELLQELHWFKQSYGSWFLGDYVCEDGSLYTATPIDPVFLLLPLFEEARMKKGNDPGKFRQLDEIIFITDYPEYQRLLSIADNCMQVVCEIKVAEAVSILGEYLKNEPWLDLLCGHLKLNLQEATRNQLEVEASPFTAENNIGSANPGQQKSGHDKKIVKTGKQVKKVKVETSSQNIKDMFTRATRKRS